MLDHTLSWSTLLLDLLYIVLKRISELSGTAILSRKSASQQTKLYLVDLGLCVCGLDSSNLAYIYPFRVILSADISSGAHREGFHLKL